MSIALEARALLARGRPLPAGETAARRAWRGAQVAGVVAALCVLVLLGDHLVAVASATGDAARIAALESQVGEDAAVAAQLHEERERQTAASLARERRGRLAAWLLLLASGVLVAFGKRAASLHPQRSPSLDEAVAVRLGLSASGRDPLAGVPVPTRPVGRTGEIDLAFVDALVERFGPSRENAIPILQAIQEHYRYLPDAALQRVCERTEITPAQIAGTSSFYAQFRRSPVGQYLVKVCHGTACHVAGAEQITQELRRHLRVGPSADTDPEGRFTLDAVACIGCCSLAPVLMVEGETAGRLTPTSAREALDALARRSAAPTSEESSS